MIDLQSKSDTQLVDSIYAPPGLCERIPGTTPQYWANLRFLGTGPKFLKISPRKVLYRWSDVQEWLESTERMSTAEAS